jgi:hypothetical protein
LYFIGARAFKGCAKLKTASFADAKNWFYVADEDSMGGLALPAADLADSSKAALYLIGKMDDGFNNWKKID